jgi:hypothetical protein
MRRLRERDEHRIARRVRLMPRHVELSHAEREINRIEIFERCGQVGEVQRQERECQNRSRGYTARRSNPSFRLPVRYPCKSRLTYL